MKIQSFLSFLVIILCTFLMAWKAEAQITGTKSPIDPVITQAPKPKQVYILALIIGVSKYREIQGLKYAHQDALDFRDYLLSKAGGSVPDSNIVSLTNKEATFEKVVNQLEWLKARALSSKIDTNKYQVKVVLFFSSHGYVDRIAYKQDTAKHGILCLHDTSPGYKDRFLSLPFLKDYAEDIAFLKKKISVNLYIDACRSGALISRTQSSILKDELDLEWRKSNITKIVACIDKQNAYEGDQWGNGIFTYYLLRGLKGLADGEEYSTIKPDGKVTVSEIKYYVTEWIAKDLLDTEQTPEKEGQDNTVLSIVDSLTLNNLVKKIAIEIPNMLKAEPKSFGESFVKELSKECQTTYTRFVNNLYLGSMDKAIQDYEQLAKITTDQTAKNLIKRELIAKLIDDSYHYLSKYLASNEKKSIIREIQLNSIIKNLEYTLGLLDKYDFRYKSFKSEKLFFECLYLRLYKNNLVLAEEYFKKALQQDGNAIYAYNELGGVLNDQKKHSEALSVSQKGLSLAPDWVYLWNNKGVVLNDLNRKKEALDAYNQAIALKPDFAMAYYNKGVALYDLNRKEEALKAYDEAISLEPNFAKAYNNKGVVLNDLNRNKEALIALDKAIALKPDYAEAYRNKGISLNRLNRNEEALLACDEAIALKPNDPVGYDNKGAILSNLNRKTEALDAYNQAINLKPDYAGAYYNKGVVLSDLNRKTEALHTYNQAIALKPDYAIAYYNISQIHSLQNQPKEALSYLEQALQKGYNNFAHIKEDTDLDNIRALPEFSTLLKKYQK